MAKKVQKADKSSSSEDSDESATSDDSNLSSDTGFEAYAEVEEVEPRPRKRRKVDQHDNLESNYLNKLIREEEKEHKGRRGEEPPQNVQGEEDLDKEGSDSNLNSELEDISDSDTEPPTRTQDDVPKHETLDDSRPDVEADKINRTVFLGNVSIGAIKSKADKKALILHLRTALDDKHGEKIESIRFRSTAFVSGAGPKRATYAKKELMEETMKSTNAYVVLSTDAAARKVALQLNGTIVLDRHLRVDSMGHPAKVDHKRCVFVGNLSFVDEATTIEETEEGGKKGKRAREPADVEEGLWRVFSKAGKVESVRVIRDKETRISKGFAYVQFESENAVEAALLMSERKFPPLLPRPLRVMRAKKDTPKKRGTSGFGKEQRNGKYGKAEARGQGQVAQRSSGVGKMVFEGHRATSGTTNGLTKVKKRPTVKPTNRSSKRGAAFKASGGKKKRDMK